MIPDELRHPIGRFAMPARVSALLLAKSIATIGDFPAQLRSELAPLSELQLDTPYRPGGWTVRQLVRHCADHHALGLMSFEKALAKQQPMAIFKKPAPQIERPDNSPPPMPMTHALATLETTHERWAALLQTLNTGRRKWEFAHPTLGQLMRLDQCIVLYAWHCQHHLAHITTLKQRQGWR